MLRQRTLRIFVVDDEALLATTLSIILRKSGYQATSFTNPVEALRSAASKAPDVLISEDARLVAMPIGGGELAVSRARPNEFMVDNWKRALRSETIVVPETFTRGDGQFEIADATELPPGAPFYCTDGVCLAKHTSGAIIAYVEDRKDSWKATALA